MMLKGHLAHSSWFSLLLWSLFGLPTAALAFVSSIMIDIDHWFWSIWAFRHWSPFRAARWHRQRLEDYSCSQYHLCCVFHTMEFIAVLAAATVLYPPFWPVLAGCLFHVILDLIDHRTWPEDRRIPFHIKYLFIPFLPKLARKEIYISSGSKRPKQKEKAFVLSGREALSSGKEGD
jgi:hypothetical protein